MKFVHIGMKIHSKRQKRRIRPAVDRLRASKIPRWRVILGRQKPLAIAIFTMAYDTTGLPKTGDTRVKVLVVMDVRPRIPSRQPTRSEPRTIPVKTNPHNNEPFAIRVESPVPPTRTGQA